jgi:hypothetical protein
MNLLSGKIPLGAPLIIGVLIQIQGMRNKLPTVYKANKTKPFLFYW